MNIFAVILRRLLWLSLFFAGGISLVLAAMFLYLSPKLPSVDSIRDVRLQTPLRIYTADNQLIGEFGEKRRTPIKLEQVPQTFINALLAAEDANFYSHNGVSIKGLLRAASQIIITGKKRSGGSTLTMQLTRHVFLTLDQTFTRKFNEILLALRIEQQLSKNEILELYVNYMFLGKRAYGIHAAAQVYYGTSLNQLSLAQLAMIAGLFQGPSTQNPIVNPTRALERRNWILGRMHELDMIDNEQLTTARNEPVTASYHTSPYAAYTPYVAELARDKTIRTFGIKAYTEGYKVYTTINLDLQLAAQDAVQKGLISYDKRHGYRGPEKRLAQKPETTPAPADETNTAKETTPASETENLETWIATLEDIPTFSDLEPALVTEAQPESVTVRLKTGEFATLSLKEDMAWARAYINENQRGPTPKSATDFLQTGDIIRIHKVLGRWQLSQIPAAQAALASLHPNTGAIAALVGGFDFNYSNYNRATQATRQPGSNFKPFIYTAALENGMTAATLINDAPVVFEDKQLEGTWRPKNDSGKFYGPTRLRKALYLSRNLVSIRLLQANGIANTINTLAKFGFDKAKLPRDLSLALGSHALTPLSLAEGYATFANGGYKVNPYLIQRILDIDDNPVYEAMPDTVCHECEQAPAHDADTAPQAIATAQTANADDFDGNNEIQALTDDFSDDPFALPFNIKSLLNILEPKDYPRATRIISEPVAFIMDSILKDVVRRGTARRARSLDRSDIAGKTGTTNGPTDVWFSGYNPDLVATTWVGFDSNAELGVREFGSSAALPIWMDYMTKALSGKPIKSRKQPDGIISVKINPETGERAKSGDPDAIFEYFRIKNAPKQQEKQPPNQQQNLGDTITEELF